MAVDGWRFRASNFFILIISFGLPLFSVPCSKGKCWSPLEVVAVYLHENALVSDGCIKSILYPAACMAKVEHIIAADESIALPNWSTLLKDMGILDVFSENQNSLGRGFVMACAGCVVGAVVAAAGSSVLGFGGMLGVLGYVYTAGNDDKSIHFLPMFGVAIFCSLASIGLDWHIEKYQEKKD